MMKKAVADQEQADLLAWAYDVAQLASFEGLKQIRERGITAFVWPDEGEFVDGKWRFNSKHDGFEPLMIDGWSASAMTLVHDALNEENKAKFERMVAAGRGQFGRIFEFSMSKVGVKK